MRGAARCVFFKFFPFYGWDVDETDCLRFFFSRRSWLCTECISVASLFTRAYKLYCPDRHRYGVFSFSYFVQSLLCEKVLREEMVLGHMCGGKKSGGEKKRSWGGYRLVDWCRELVWDCSLRMKQRKTGHHCYLVWSGVQIVALVKSELHWRFARLLDSRREQS